MDGCSSFDRLSTERQVSLEHQCLVTGCSCPCFTAGIVQLVVCLGYRLHDLQLPLFHSQYSAVGGMFGYRLHDLQLPLFHSQYNAVGGMFGLQAA